MRMQSPIFPDNVVIVTGAGRGVGRRIALALAREGAKVVISDTGRTQEGTGDDSTVAGGVVQEILNAGGDAIAYTGSVLTPAGANTLIDVAVERYGRVDALILRGAPLRDTPLLETSDQAWQHMVDTCLSSGFYLSRAFSRHISINGSSGRIVHILPAPPVADDGTSPAILAMSMSLAGLALATAREFTGKGITANAVAPVSAGVQEGGEDRSHAALPVEQMVSLVLYLASREGAATTGEVFGVAGQHIFAYKTDTTPGVKKHGATPWTPSQIYYRMADIEKVPVPRQPPNPALKSSPRPAPAAPAKQPAARPKPKRKSTPIESEPFLPPGPGATSSDPVERTFGLLPLGFRQSKAPGKSFHIYFDIEGGPGHTVRLENGEFTVEKGKVGEPRCIVKGPANVVVGMFTGAINAEKAFVSGQLTTTSLAELMALGMVLDPRKAKLAFQKGLAPEPKSPEAEQPPVTSGPPADTAGDTEPAADPVAGIFERLPQALLADKATGKAFHIYFDLKDAPSRSLILEDGRLRVEPGKAGTPTCIVRTDAETIVGVFSGKIKPEAAFMQGRFSATNLVDMMTLNQVVSIRQAMAATRSDGHEDLATPGHATREGTDKTPGRDGLDPVAAVFQRLPQALIQEKAADKSFNIYFDLKDAPPHSLVLEAGTLRAASGRVGTPTCIVRTDAETITGVFSGKIKAEVAFMQGRFSATNLTDMMTLNQVLSLKRLS